MIEGKGAALSMRHEQWKFAREMFEYLSLPLSPPGPFVCTHPVGFSKREISQRWCQQTTRFRQESWKQEEMGATSTTISVVQGTEDSETRRSRNKYFIFASLGIFVRTTSKVGGQRRVRLSTSGRKRTCPDSPLGLLFVRLYYYYYLLLKRCTFVSTCIVCFFFYFDPAGPKTYKDNTGRRNPLGYALP